MRGGERFYYDYARHHNRFAGDLSLHHWTAGDKFRGGWAEDSIHQGINLPLYWGDHSSFRTGSVPFFNWPLEYYLTGDEYAHELIQMVGDAYREHWDPERHLDDSAHGQLLTLAVLYQLEWDDTFNEIARQVAPLLIDLDNPVGLNDDQRRGVFYKTSREWLYPLYSYYQATGDDAAREAILRAMDDKFRFNHVLDRTSLAGGRGPAGSQHYGTFLWSVVYKWTGDSSYLPIIQYMVEELPDVEDFDGNYLPAQTNVYQGVPLAQWILAATDEPIGPFPILAMTRDRSASLQGDFVRFDLEELPPLRVHKDAEDPVRLSIYVRIASDEVEDTEAVAEVTDSSGRPIEGVEIASQQKFATSNESRRDIRRWHFHVTLPAELPAGEYAIAFPKAGTVTVLTSDAPDLFLKDF